MITSIPLLLSVLWVPILSWINFSSAFILFGLYYGFIATLPLGPSQLISIRAFLLEGNLGGAAAVIGLITGQLIIFLSVYYSPIYVILVKPHILTLLVSPYIFFYWYRIKDLSNYQCLRPVTSLQDTRIYKIFFDSIIFQLLNPILLPSPVLARLLNIIFFRYSNNILFLTSTIFSWLCGQYLLISFGKSLLFRIESDSPILYLLVKRTIHRTFSIIILSFSLLHLGRTPVPFITKKIIESFQFNSSKEVLISQKPWPNLFFDYRRWNRPLRYIGNSRSSTRSPIKKKVSQYFFDICLSDGKQRLSFAYLPSLAIFQRSFKKCFNGFKFLTSSEFFEEWTSARTGRKEYIYNEFQHRINFLDNGSSLKEVTEKKTGLSNFEGRIFNKIYDPLLTGQYHKAMIISRSSWLLTERYNKLRKKQKSPLFLRRENKLKNWIYNQWQKLEYKTLILPWEPLTRDARRMLSSLINKSKKIGIDQNFKQFNIFDGDTIIDSTEKSTSAIWNTYKKMNRKSNLNWELILNLSPRQKIVYLNYLQIDRWKTIKNSWRNLFVGDITRVPSRLAETLRIDKKFKFQEINKEIPRCTSDLKNDKFDVIAIGVTDIRQRKVKNLGYLIKGRDRRRKIVRRFSQQSDFRRKLVKGSMRARRRKTLIWKMFQLGINSPFFLRINEKPIFIRTLSYGKKLSDSKWTFRDISLDINKKTSEEKALFFERTRADRLAIANRWDFPLAQWGRSWLLIIQSHFRKYIVLPVLVILKNVLRSLLFQNPEWNEDWSEWNKEVHIRCTYDGTEVSEKELPEQWLRDGLQIKIIYPFRLKPWHNPNSQNEISGRNEEYYKKVMKKKKFHYCYLTAWGFRTDLPFGNMKKQPSFLKPINNELRKKLRKNIFFKSFLVNNKSSIMFNISGSKKTNTQPVKYTDESNLNNLCPNQKNDGKNSNNEMIAKLSVGHNDHIVSDILKKFEYETIYIQNLENFIAKGDAKETENYLVKNNEEITYLKSISDERKLAKVLIRIKQIIIQFRREIKEWLFFLKINIQRIKMNLGVNIEIIRESIKNFFSNN
uniref:Protein TIC 214 n=1 Tax=Apopellia endiviifolia TaxID=304445 RepID=K4JWS3_9MARC|nr:hypothetical chloroplast RF19 [Apopellia endiviifolia]AFU88906.1 hypothetical chloroplast RF19 [Apopellia endiviifolia]WIA67789.1 hypothetical chloroplast RF19 [Apopellia endiviifolia]WKW94998.1 hypothetical chloroplast RF19 [Apopellia endiviifolia]